MTDLDRAEAVRLLELSRRADWSFPTSFSNSRVVRPGADHWLDDLASQRDALAAAVHFFVDDGDEAAAELASNVWRLWQMEGDIAGARALLAPVLAATSTSVSRHRAKAMYGDALLAIKQGKLEESRARSAAALEIATELDDIEGQVLGLLGLSRVAMEEGDYAQAQALAAQSRELARRLDPAMAQAPLHTLGQSTRMLGDYEAAAPLFAESLELNRQLGDEGMVSVELHNLGHVEAHRGNIAAAEHCFAEAAERSDPADPYDTVMRDLNEAVLAFLRGDRVNAGELLERAQAAVTTTGIDLANDDLLELDWLAKQLAGRGL